MNKQTRGGEEIFLPYNRIPINKVKKMMELEKSPLGSHYNDNCFRQKSTMTPKTRGESMMKYLCMIHLLISKKVVC